MGLFFVVGASLLLHMVLYAESFMWVPRHTKDTLFVSAVSKHSLTTWCSNKITINLEPIQIIGYVCAFEAIVLSAIAFYPTIRRYRRVPNGDCEELFLDEGREMSPMSPMSGSDLPNHTNALSSPGSDDYQHKQNHSYENNHQNNHNNHHDKNNCTMATASNQKPYIPGKSLNKNEYM